MAIASKAGKPEDARAFDWARARAGSRVGCVWPIRTGFAAGDLDLEHGWPREAQRQRAPGWLGLGLGLWLGVVGGV